ncbi:MAG: hypothetical protein SCARUB_03190 [Candidatus Scalindua rubra]|uniref:Uncharacterized protein n=1 Tax=Candidatus Scalindua rubra TaxID=1872076 RepID=A0A1E3X7Y3_9BACT|nr:MAG: hypothetical protein SCARUB_03190 [Candidatus Scalindua rubra]
MNLNQRIIRALAIVLTIGIIIFLTLYSVIIVHNTEDPYFAKKIVLITMALIIVSIMTGGFVLYYLREEKREESN